MSSKTLTEQEIFDLGHEFHPNQPRDCTGRVDTAAVWGGKLRQVMVDLDPAGRCMPKGYRRPMYPTRLNSQSLILPAGEAKFGDRDYFIRVNSSPLSVPN